MPIGVDIDIETVDMDNPSGGVAGASLFYPLKVIQLTIWYYK